jgi:hypothetical protein
VAIDKLLSLWEFAAVMDRSDPLGITDSEAVA